MLVTQDFVGIQTHSQHDSLLCLSLLNTCFTFSRQTDHLIHSPPPCCYMVTNNSFPIQAHIQRIKDKRAAKEEKARYEKMAEKMHAKRVERLKRREKRNKLLNS